MPVRRIEKKIYYHDTDCGEVVYYANHLKYLEEGRTEYFNDQGQKITELNKAGLWFIVARVEIDYLMPAKYQDTLTICTSIEKIKAASMIFTQTIERGKDLIARAKVVLVCINDDFKPLQIPDYLRSGLSA